MSSTGTAGSTTQRTSKSSPIPALGEGFQESKSNLPDHSKEGSDIDQEGSNDPKDLKDQQVGKRRLFGFGKKRDDKGKGKKFAVEVPGKSTTKDEPTAQSRSAESAEKISPVHTTHPYQTYSPNRNLHSPSPRVVSPAGSQIFERDVQESTLPPNSPAIPSHIQTENHIPSVLDASSEAITDKNVDPDTVEIVMHSSHQPAAVTVTGVGNNDVAGALWPDDLIARPDKDDAASNYGALDGTDVRRLSFISFADVVQSEHAEHSSVRESIHIAGLTSLSSGHRSPSPMRSPVSSPGLRSSPPTSKSASIKGLDLSPGRSSKALGSPTSGIPALTTGGELTIETMSQALKKMGSGDLSGAKSQQMSPVSEDGAVDRLAKQ